ncbi:MAG: XamI family restriction endonuclease [Chloroflexi bacterium]|nr:XamI family restriction endonuclease [Chloroflexota bacterium]
MNSPPIWSEQELDNERERSLEHFRQGRHTEPLELYLELFDDYREVVEEVLEQTVDLSRLRDEAPNLLGDRRKLEVIRYLSGPPVSEDDLKTLIRSQSLNATRITSDPALVDRLVTFIQDWHDRRRFPWVNESRDPEEYDRNAAILATTSLLAMRRLETMRRSQSKVQERLVATQLRRAQFRQVDPRIVRVLSQAPDKGQFCRESMLGNRKADLLIGLHDGRTLALECKVSNSSTNSIKRLNNDAVAKATSWKNEFGSSQVVTAAVLAGVFALRNLLDAQDKGLTLFWSHDLATMLDWIRPISSDTS